MWFCTAAVATRSRADCSGMEDRRRNKRPYQPKHSPSSSCLPCEAGKLSPRCTATFVIFSIALCCWPFLSTFLPPLPFLSRPQVDLTFERFRFLAPCQRLRAIVCVLSSHSRDNESSTCVCLRLREQCLRSEITSVSRVANVLLLRFVAGNMDVNTPASKRSQLIGNTAIVRKRCVIHKKSTCVC